MCRDHVQPHLINHRVESCPGCARNPSIYITSGEGKKITEALPLANRTQKNHKEIINRQLSFEAYEDSNLFSSSEHMSSN